MQYAHDPFLVGVQTHHHALRVKQIWRSGLVGLSPMGFHSDFDGALKVQWLLLVHEYDRDHSVGV
jgi:hypothetical protein